MRAVRVAHARLGDCASRRHRVQLHGTTQWRRPASPHDRRGGHGCRAADDGDRRSRARERGCWNARRRRRPCRTWNSTPSVICGIRKLKSRRIAEPARYRNYLYLGNFSASSPPTNSSIPFACTAPRPIYCRATSRLDPSCYPFWRLLQGNEARLRAKDFIYDRLRCRGHRLRPGWLSCRDSSRPAGFQHSLR